MRGNELLDKMELVAPIYIEAADISPEKLFRPETPRRSKRRMWNNFAAIAVCLCLVTAGSTILYHQINRKNFDVPFVVEYVENLADISSVYEGTLLAENLQLSDATATSIQLIRSEDASRGDTADWDKLSISAEYPDYSLLFECSFQGRAGSEYFSDIYDTIQYGDILVNLYQKDSPSDPELTGSEFIYGATFAYDGIFYELLIHTEHPESIYELLDTIIGTPSAANASETPEQADESDGQEYYGALGNILGFENWYVKIEEITPYFFTWYYYTDIDGEAQCIAESFGYREQGVQAYSVDLDDDGVPELICNCVYGDGVERVVTYRNHNGAIETGFIEGKLLQTEYHIDTSVAANAIIMTYDPEENVIHITNYASDGSVRELSFEGREYFKLLTFLPYQPSSET